MRRLSDGVSYDQCFARFFSNLLLFAKILFSPPKRAYLGVRWMFSVVHMTTGELFSEVDVRDARKARPDNMLGRESEGVRKERKGPLGLDISLCAPCPS